MKASVRRVHQLLSRDIDRILGYFVDGAKVTIVVRNSDVRQDADVLVGNDEPREAIKAIEKLLASGDVDDRRTAATPTPKTTEPAPARSGNGDDDDPRAVTVNGEDIDLDGTEDFTGFAVAAAEDYDFDPVAIFASEDDAHAFVKWIQGDDAPEDLATNCDMAVMPVFAAKLVAANHYDSAKCVAALRIMTGKSDAQWRMADDATAGEWTGTR